MNLLDYLRQVAKSETAIYARFLQQYNHHNQYLHIFHEGKDDPSFYGNYIYSFVSTKRIVYYYQCKSKENVYKNYSKLNWSAYNKKRILFFVDKDHSDLLSIIYPIDTNIFVTKYYSIENYIVTKHIFSRCIRDFLGLDNDQLISALEKMFAKGLKQFYSNCLFLSAYMLYHRQKQNPINLSNITLGDLFYFSGNFEIKKKPFILEKLDKLTGATTQNCFKEIRSLIYELKKINEPKYHIRGKFELMYLVKCFNECAEIINQNRRPGEKKYKCLMNLSLNNAVAVIAPRLKHPIDLKQFLRTNLKN